LLPELLRRDEREIFEEWVAEQLRTVRRTDLIRDSQLREESAQFLRQLAVALDSGSDSNVAGPAFAGVRDVLADLSRARGYLGFSPSETALFVLSMKRPLFSRLRAELAHDSGRLADETWAATELLDRLALFTTEVYQKSREEVIVRQQQEMLELSTPVVKLWTGVLALPLIGTLDSARTQVVMESLLQRIVETGSQIAIIDITGVPTVDTLTAQHLLKTVTAARLMGADCIISGIRPQIAQTIVHLGVDLADITTKATLADAFVLALQRTGSPLGRGGPAPTGGSMASALPPRG
jgi:rsbT co-antagonist protein RsbR